MYIIVPKFLQLQAKLISIGFQIYQLLIPSLNIYCTPSACQAFESFGDTQMKDGLIGLNNTQNTVLVKRMIYKWPSTNQYDECYRVEAYGTLSGRDDSSLAFKVKSRHYQSE